MEKCRAKFVCNGVIDAQFGKEKVIHMSAVYSDKGENADFCNATPCGNLDMHISENTEAASFFVQGKEYYLDFSVAE